MLSGDYAELIVQTPNFYGTLESLDKIQKHQKTMLIVCVEWLVVLY